jgi:lipoic acid synthetase
MGGVMGDPKALRKPDWLKVRLGSGRNYFSVESILRDKNLHTVCQEANCPNQGECFSDSTATFLILGDTCTRNCRYCNVKHGSPDGLDEDEPRRVREAVKRLNLDYVVITSVTRDDLPDGGAGIFLQTVNELKSLPEKPKVEILIPDFKSDPDSIRLTANSGADVINHNIEVTKNIFPIIRPEGSYEASLRLLKKIKEINPRAVTKSGLMIGLGESHDNIFDTMRDLIGAGVDIITIGQYLQPSKLNAEVKNFYTPDDFKGLRGAGLEMGFKEVLSGPLVRSSYKAKEAYEKVIGSYGDTERL